MPKDLYFTLNVVGVVFMAFGGHWALNNNLFFGLGALLCVPASCRTLKHFFKEYL
jgi:hypothetical protein